MKETAILLPIDNRPITYTFPQLICHLANLNVLIPPRNLLGTLSRAADFNGLFNWLEQSVKQVGSGAVFICLDSLLYGGLIPARRSNDDLDSILSRLSRISELKKVFGKLKIYAQASIMRISDNYDNTEENEYWSQFGREIFYWSELLHKKEIGQLDSDTELKSAESSITPDVRHDYIFRRKRNFSVNEHIIDHVVAGNIDQLVFSQDDSGKFGLNVLEKNKLKHLAEQKHLSNILVYAGADEVLMALIAHYLNSDLQPLVNVEYSCSAGKEIPSNYEGQSVGESVVCQLKAQNIMQNNESKSDITTRKNIDFTVIIHTGIDRQGDHIWLPGLQDLRSINTNESAARAIALIKDSTVPVVICDVAYSNGADPVLINLLLDQPELFDKIWYYSGWNTTGNTIGSSLAVGSACWHASRTGNLDNEQRLKLLFLRLLDDWAYQTQVRKKLSDKQSQKEQEYHLKTQMDEYATKLTQVLKYKPHSQQYKLPWQRTFEIEIY